MARNRLREGVLLDDHPQHRAEAAGGRLRFLPPYSPDFNPIETAFSRLETMLRQVGERTVSGLWLLIGKLVDLFQPQECANYFGSCGYDPDSKKVRSKPAPSIATFTPCF